MLAPPSTAANQKRNFNQIVYTNELTLPSQELQTLTRTMPELIELRPSSLIDGLLLQPWSTWL
jgi:hypothetical protein